MCSFVRVDATEWIWGIVVATLWIFVELRILYRCQKGEGVNGKQFFDDK